MKTALDYIVCLTTSGLWERLLTTQMWFHLSFKYAYAQHLNMMKCVPVLYNAEAVWETSSDLLGCASLPGSHMSLKWQINSGAETLRCIGNTQASFTMPLSIMPDWALSSAFNARIAWPFHMWTEWWYIFLFSGPIMMAEDRTVFNGTECESCYRSGFW